MNPLPVINRLLVVDRERFLLQLYKRHMLATRFYVAKHYKVAVGKAGFETPRGLYLITSRSNCPTWTMPDSDWVDPELRGKTLACKDPANPIVSRWLGIYEGVGIHGTNERESIGSAASHGCIRMLVENVQELYRQVPVNTPCYIL